MKNFGSERQQIECPLCHQQRKPKVNQKEKPSEKVKIQIGIKEFNEIDCTLKMLKGRGLPVTVDACTDASKLLVEALTKHTKHFRSFNPAVEFLLLYPDNTVVKYLPGSSQVFSLKDYKDDLGKPYSKI